MKNFLIKEVEKELDCMEKKGFVRASTSSDIPGPSIDTYRSILQQLKKKIRLEAEVEVRMRKIIVSF